MFERLSIDPRDPKAAEFTLLGTAMPVGILPSIVNLFDRNVKGLAACAVVPLRVLEQAIAATSGFEASFYSGHLCSP
jgi:hypothetical protein